MVTKCPICEQFLVGFNWTKTAKGKNWLKKGDKWHDCPKNKSKKKSSEGNMKIVDYGPMVDVPNGMIREGLLGKTTDHDANRLYYSPENNNWYSPHLDQQGQTISYKADELEQAKKDGYTDIIEDWRIKKKDL